MHTRPRDNPPTPHEQAGNTHTFPTRSPFPIKCLEKLVNFHVLAEQSPFYHNNTEKGPKHDNPSYTQSHERETP